MGDAETIARLAGVSPFLGWREAGALAEWHAARQDWEPAGEDAEARRLAEERAGEHGPPIVVRLGRER